MLQLCFDMFSKLYLLHYFQMASFDVMTIQEAQRAREEGEKRRRERDHKYGDRRRRRKVIYFPLDCILFFGISATMKFEPLISCILSKSLTTRPLLVASS